MYDVIQKFGVSQTWLEAKGFVLGHLRKNGDRGIMQPGGSWQQRSAREQTPGETVGIRNFQGLSGFLEKAAVERSG